MPAQERRGPALQEPVAVTFRSQLPEAGDTEIIVGGAVEFAGAHGGQWGSPWRREQERWQGRWAGLVLTKHSDVRQMDE